MPQLHATNYIIGKGDTLTAIANRYRTSVSYILSLNVIANPDKINEGDTILVPIPSKQHLDQCRREAFRQTGRTRTQVQTAPLHATYVCYSEGAVDPVKALAKQIGRNDLNVMSLETAIKYSSTAPEHFVMDHAAAWRALRMLAIR